MASHNSYPYASGLPFDARRSQPQSAQSTQLTSMQNNNYSPQFQVRFSLIFVSFYALNTLKGRCEPLVGVLSVPDVSYFASEPREHRCKQDVHACGRAQSSSQVAPAPRFCFPYLECGSCFEFIFDGCQRTAPVCDPTRVRRVYRLRQFRYQYWKYAK